MSGRRLGDRKDGTLLRDMDAIHFICPIIYPNRCDNEAFISETIDLTSIDAYLEKKNADGPEYKYNLFQVVVTAFLKVVYQRPVLNRFIVNGNTYQRNEITTSFIVKKQFSDKGEEGVAFIKAKPEFTIRDIHDLIYKEVSTTRSGGGGGSTEDAMDIVTKLPRFISKPFIHFVMFLDRHGWAPNALIARDPYYSTVMFSNLGSVKLHSGYHHLTNWGTNSIFVIIGERKIRPFYADDGAVTMKDSVDLGLTVDERIGDGYYFSKTIRLLKTLLENPDLLDKPFAEEVEYQ